MGARSSEGTLGAAPTLEALEPLVTSANVRDRAFAASVLTLRRRPKDRERVAVLYERVREAARREHAEVRERIRQGALDTRAFAARLLSVELDIRDHFVEEVLDIAYPPLLLPREETALPREATPYCPSGLAEIVFMLERADLGPSTTFVDLGSGLGKVVLLVALLTSAHAYGVELDPHLASHARSAARSLCLDHAHFIEGDIRDAPLPPADVYYMYMPLMQSTPVVARLAPFAAAQRVLVFSQTLDLRQLPWLEPTGEASYWLTMYEGGRAQGAARGVRP